MKSCLGSLLLFIALIALLATGGGIWYLSKTAKFSRKDQAAEVPAATTPAPTNPTTR
jgi:hypothetical protein